MGKIIGIDLGTTNSAFAVMEGDSAEVIANSEGDRTTPSVVAYKDGKRIVGKTALSQAVINVDNTAYSVKRFIGREYDELTDLDKEGLAYKLSSDSKNRPILLIDTDGDGRAEELLPEQISAGVLSKIKEDASKYLGEDVTDAVITVPAYFNDTQRQATKDAGRIAGLNVQRIINEPTAAALAYGFGKGGSGSKKLLVFDLGGGTLDISILNVSNDFVDVVSTSGDNHLGGDLWDSTFCTYIEDRFQDEFGVDLAADPQTHARVLEVCRAAKHELSNAESANINLPFIAMGPSGSPLNLNYDITRAEFESVTRNLLERCKKPIDDAMNGLTGGRSLSFSDIDDVLLVGGSTRMPAVQELVESVTGKKPELTINPDEAVALGAAIEGGVLNGECSDIVLSDVTSMSLGLRIFRGGSSIPVVHRMIERNTPLPTSANGTFSTREDNQPNVQIVLVQGEDEDPDSPNNKILGTCTLDGIPPMPANQPQIEVTLTYNTEGMVEVDAVEKISGKKIHAIIGGSTKLLESEIMAFAAEESNN